MTPSARFIRAWWVAYNHQMHAHRAPIMSPWWPMHHEVEYAGAIAHTVLAVVLAALFVASVWLNVRHDARARRLEREQLIAEVEFYAREYRP